VAAIRIEFLITTLITGIGVMIGVITLFVVIQNRKRTAMHKIVDFYIENPPQYSDEGLDILLKAGAITLSSKELINVCRRIEERGCENPYKFCEREVKENKKNYKKTLLTLNKRNKK